MPKDNRVTHLVHDALNSTDGCVSSDAFSRHGEIVEWTESKLEFEITAKVTGTRINSNRHLPSQCPVCHSSSPDNVTQLLLENPVPGSRYVIPHDSSHRVIDCPKCGQAGEIVCPECNGNGRVACSDCGGTGVVVSEFTCTMCEGEEKVRKECPECGGEGVLYQEEPCKCCNSEGHTRCQSCAGSGTVICDRCNGEECFHKFKETEFNIIHSVESNGLPSFWVSNPTSLLQSLGIQREDIESYESKNHIVRLDIERFEGTLVAIRYGDDPHNVLALDNHDFERPVWDPGTSYPATSMKRKLSDLKSRLLW